MAVFSARNTASYRVFRRVLTAVVKPADSRATGPPLFTRRGYKQTDYKNTRTTNGACDLRNGYSKPWRGVGVVEIDLEKTSSPNGDNTFAGVAWSGRLTILMTRAERTNSLYYKMTNLSSWLKGSGRPRYARVNSRLARPVTNSPWPGGASPPPVVLLTARRSPGVVAAAAAAASARSVRPSVRPPRTTISVRVSPARRPTFLLSPRSARRSPGRLRAPVATGPYNTPRVRARKHLFQHAAFPAAAAGEGGPRPPQPSIHVLQFVHTR